jgi:fibronectin type 3 domain-containing protein
MRVTSACARALLAVLALWLGTACATSLDLERARSVFTRRPQPETPVLLAGPPSALPAPEGVIATSGQLREVPLQWEPVITGDVGGYVVDRAFAASGPFARVAVLAGRNTTLWVDRGSAEGAAATAPSALGDGVTAHYRVRSFSRTGQLGVEPTVVASATTAPPPAPPAALRAYSHQPRQVPLAWRASDDPNVTAYRVYRSPSFRGSFERLATVEGRFQTIYNDKGLGDLRVFYYRVAAVNRAGGEGRASEPVRAVTKPAPLPPLGLRVSAQRLGANQLSWEPNVETNLVGYRLLRQRAGSKQHELVATLSPDQTASEDAAVSADEPLDYTLVAVDEDGLASDPAEPVVVKSVGYDISATARVDGVHLAWNPRSEEGFVGAHVYRHGALSRSELGFVTGASFVDAEAKPGGRYRYTVVLERADKTLAPTSPLVEIQVPER